MKKLFLMLGGVALFIVVVGLLVKAQKGEKNVFSGIIKSSPAPLVISNPKQITVGAAKFSVSVAANDADRQRGLSGVSSMKDDQGMLFVFDSKNIVPSFWMKDMLIPLDFVWISGNRVVEINQNVPAPAPNTPDRQLVVYTPKQPIDYVLEVNSGVVAKNNIKVGDQTQLGL